MYLTLSLLHGYKTVICQWEDHFKKNVAEVNSEGQIFLDVDQPKSANAKPNSKRF